MHFCWKRAPATLPTCCPPVTPGATWRRRALHLPRRVQAPAEGARLGHGAPACWCLQPLPLPRTPAAAPAAVCLRRLPRPLPPARPPCSTACPPSTWPAPSATCLWTWPCPRWAAGGWGLHPRTAPAPRLVGGRLLHSVVRSIVLKAHLLPGISSLLPRPPSSSLQCCVGVVYFMGGLRLSAAAFFGQLGVALLTMLVAQVGTALKLLLGCWRLLVLAGMPHAAPAAHCLQPSLRQACIHCNPPPCSAPHTAVQSIGLLLGSITMVGFRAAAEAAGSCRACKQRSCSSRAADPAVRPSPLPPASAGPQDGPDHRLPGHAGHGEPGRLIWQGCQPPADAGVPSRHQRSAGRRRRRPSGAACPPPPTGAHGRLLRAGPALLG